MGLFRKSKDRSPSTNYVNRVAEVERKIERELRQYYSDSSVMHNYTRWRNISLKGQDPYSNGPGPTAAYMTDQVYRDALNHENIRDSAPFKRILKAMRDRDVFTFERR